MIICIGPVCIPLWGLAPFLLAFMSKCWTWVQQRMGLAKTAPAPKALVSPSSAAVEAALARSIGEGAAAAAEEASPSSAPPPPSVATAAAAAAAAAAQPLLVVATRAEWDALLARGSAEQRPIFVDFGAGFCAPCKRIAPVFAGLAVRHAQRALFARVESDASDAAEALADSCGVSCFPTFQCYSSGAALLGQFVGAKDEELAQFVLTHLSTVK
jgi:thioredoxin 1